MSQPLGQTRWVLAEGYIPAYGNGPEPQFNSHETACLLNTSDQDAHVKITIYFSDREPVGLYRVMFRLVAQSIYGSMTCLILNQSLVIQTMPVSLHLMYRS